MPRDYKKELGELIGLLEHEGASDLHLAARRKPFIRVSGGLIPLVKREELTDDMTFGILGEMISDEKKEVFLKKKELDFSYTTETSMRFRGNAFFQQGLLSIALRLIPAKIQTLAELNLPPILETFARRKQGFFLVVGPVGQGKSTTLAAMIDLIHKERAEHIMTIEDPIEFMYGPGNSIIDQREVGRDTEDFQSALRSMFREDIDVAMIGEMRGPETMSAAVTAAETGHLVFSTLHTNNAAQTIDRIIDTFPSDQQNQIRGQLSQSLAGIFSQRLIPRISGGVIPAYELLVNTNAVANLIREKRTHEINVVIETGSGEGMISMDRTLGDLVRRGEIAPEEAEAYSVTEKMVRSR
ncbi:MAG: PilT/PilU family type 4a pilus ATPase [Patescibacteria group bacterium]